MTQDGNGNIISVGFLSNYSFGLPAGSVAGFVFNVYGDPSVPGSYSATLGSGAARYISEGPSAGIRTIGGNGFLNIELREVDTAVPEPSTFALLGVGGIALAGYGWRRKRQQAV